jgi:hypothetical protein
MSSRRFETLDKQLADVRGGAGPMKPANVFVHQNPPRLNDVIGLKVTPEQRQQNDLLKQKLKDQRWIRHKDTPHWERDETTGFAVPI